MHPSSRLRRRRLGSWLLAFVLLSSGSALAYGGFTLGISGGVPTGGAYVLNVRAVQPLATVTVNGTPLQFSARADVATSLAFDTIPAVGLGVLTGATADGIERYLGVGGGVSPSASDDVATLWSAYGLAGFRTPLAAGFHGSLEFQLTGNALFTEPRVTLGLEYTFGGER